MIGAEVLAESHSFILPWRDHLEGIFRLADSLAGESLPPLGRAGCKHRNLCRVGEVLVHEADRQDSLCHSRSSCRHTNPTTAYMNRHFNITTAKKIALLLTVSLFAIVPITPAQKNTDFNAPRPRVSSSWTTRAAKSLRASSASILFKLRICLIS